MKKSEEIARYFDELYPNAKCELTYNSDYGFLIAVMLSAQCTDNKVNKVTPILFSKYKSLEELDKASLSDLEEIIKPLGLYKNKAANIKSITHDLLTKFNGSVPKDKKDLMSLSGVGNKTANVVRIELFKEKEFPVDTHVKRVANIVFNYIFHSIPPILMLLPDHILQVQVILKNLLFVQFPKSFDIYY